MRLWLPVTAIYNTGVNWSDRYCCSTLIKAMKTTDVVRQRGDKADKVYALHRYMNASIVVHWNTDVHGAFTNETTHNISTHKIITIITTTLKCYKAFLFSYGLDISELWTRDRNSSLTFFSCHSNSCRPHDGIPLPLAHSRFMLLIWLQIRPSSHHPACGLARITHWWFLFDASWNECWLFDVCPILLNPQWKLSKTVDKINKVFPRKWHNHREWKDVIKVTVPGAYS